MSEPKWFSDAARLLAEGHTIADTARAVGCARESLSRRFNAPGGTLRAEVERRRAALASDTADKNASLIEDAMAVLGRGVKSADDKRSLDAAKFLLGKLLPSQQVVKVEERRADVVSPDEAVRELASALVVAADVIAEGGVSTEVVAMLAEAASRLVAASSRVPHLNVAASPTNEELPASAVADAQGRQALR